MVYREEYCYNTVTIVAGEVKRGKTRRSNRGKWASVSKVLSFEERTPRRDEVSPFPRNRLIILQILFLTYT